MPRSQILDSRVDHTNRGILTTTSQLGVRPKCKRFVKNMKPNYLYIRKKLTNSIKMKYMILIWSQIPLFTAISSVMRISYMHTCRLQLNYHIDSIIEQDERSDVIEKLSLISLNLLDYSFKSCPPRSSQTNWSCALVFESHASNNLPNIISITLMSLTFLIE